MSKHIAIIAGHNLKELSVDSALQALKKLTPYCEKISKLMYGYIFSKWNERKEKKTNSIEGILSFDGPGPLISFGKQVVWIHIGFEYTEFFKRWEERTEIRKFCYHFVSILESPFVIYSECMGIGIPSKNSSEFVLDIFLNNRSLLEVEEILIAKRGRSLPSIKRLEYRFVEKKRPRILDKVFFIDHFEDFRTDSLD